jgi:hypothetical protein
MDFDTQALAPFLPTCIAVRSLPSGSDEVVVLGNTSPAFNVLCTLQRVVIRCNALSCVAQVEAKVVVLGNTGPSLPMQHHNTPHG